MQDAAFHFSPQNHDTEQIPKVKKKPVFYKSRLRQTPHLVKNKTGVQMLDVDETVVKNVRKYLKEVAEKGLPVRFGILFGSQVNGIRHEWSDIDLIVVSPRFDGRRNRRELTLLWRAARLTDNRIEPVPCGEKQWEEDDVSPIIIVARREGVRIDI